MAKVALISAKMANDLNPQGSVVGVFPDDEPFNGGMSNFDVKIIPGTVQEVESDLAKLLPKDVDESKMVRYDFCLKDDTKSTVADAFESKQPTIQAMEI